MIHLTGRSDAAHQAAGTGRRSSVLPVPKPRTDGADTHAGKDASPLAQRGSHGVDGPSPKRLVALAFATADKIRQVRLTRRVPQTSLGLDPCAPERR